ncbi:MAG: hypothetical protein JWN15_2736 [Firmicutes bacterium]|nr:hypothetical protein [Bacillota bacterium]
MAAADVKEHFLADLTIGVIESGGTSKFDQQKARTLAEKVLDKLYEIGPFAYPSLLDEDGLRFVYQWDEHPPLLTVMLWNDILWQDMARIRVPMEIDADINQ